MCQSRSSSGPLTLLGQSNQYPFRRCGSSRCLFRAARTVLFAAFLALLGSLACVTAAVAYRPSHGFLPGSTSCDLHVPVTLGVPANAAPVPDPTLGELSHGFYHVEEISDGLFYATEGVYQTIFLVDDDGIVVVDAPPSIGFNPTDPSQSVSFVDVIYSVPETAGKAIVGLVYSHSHLDHIGAAGLIRDAFPTVEIVAHRETRRQLARGTGSFGPFLPGAGSVPPPLPTFVFETGANLRLGSQRLQLRYLGPVHEPGNIFIFAPHQRVLMLVDVIFPGWSPFSDLALAEDVPMFVEAHDLALSFDFHTFVGGHLNRLGRRADVEQARRYIHDVRTNAIAALSDPSLFQIFGVVPSNPLGAFAVYLDQVACRCANLTLDPAMTPSGESWLGQLGAADINTVGHCWQMAESLRIDSAF